MTACVQAVLFIALVCAAAAAAAAAPPASALHKPPRQLQNNKKKGTANKAKAVLNFLSGGLAGMVSSTVTAPLEVVKTQLQASRFSGKLTPFGVCQEIVKADGPGGLFKGLKPLLVGIIPTRAIYFWAYAGTKASLNATIGNGPLNHLASAFAAGITSNTVTSPLWTVKTRFQILADPTVGQRRYKNYMEVVQSMWKEEGAGAFFKGLTASYVGCFEGAIQWIVYEKLKTVLSAPRPVPVVPAKKRSAAASKQPPPQQRTPSPAEYFLAAAFSKLVAIAFTYPHEVVRTRMREQATNGLFKYTGFVNTLQVIAREEGTRGLYGGIGIHIMRSVPNAAVMFVTFEVVSKWLSSVDFDNIRWPTVAAEGKARVSAFLAPPPTLRSLPVCH